MESSRDYAVYLFQLREEAETQKKITALRKSTTGGHADEIETAELGEVRLASRSRQLAEAVKAIKADTTTIRLQDDFFLQSLSPLQTEVWE